jgi:HEAT repeat protein
MKRLVVLVLALGFLGLCASEAGAQKRKAEVEKLVKVMKADKDAKNRAEAAQALYRIGEVRAADIRPHTEAFVEVFQKDADGNVRVAAGNCLLVAEPDAKLVIEPVSAVLKDDKAGNGVFTTAALVLAQFGPKSKEAALQRLIELQKRESAKDEKTRDNNLLQAVNTAINLINK